MEKAPKILVVAAWPPELKQLRGKLRTSPYREWRGRVESAAVGVGLIESAIGTTALLARFKPDMLVLIGTAGVFDCANVEILEAAAVSTTVIGSPEKDDVAQLPAPMPRESMTSRRLTSAMSKTLGLKTTRVVCPLAITRTVQRAEALMKVTGASLENLEVFAVAQAAKRAKVPFVAVLGVANTVGPKGAHQWRKYGEAAAATACDAVCTWLSNQRQWEKLLPKL
jgi:nucleoside phosphorylase